MRVASARNWLTQVAERFQLPQETTDKIYQMKQEAEKLQQKIDNNPNLTDQQRASALAGIAKETENSVNASFENPHRNFHRRKRETAAGRYHVFVRTSDICLPKAGCPPLQVQGNGLSKY